MFRFLIKYFTISLVIIFLLSLFPNITTTVRFTLVSIVKNIFPDEKIKPIVDNTKLEKPHETISANSFEIYTSELNSFAGYNINSDGSTNNQHKSSGLYGEISNGKTILKLFTRDGSVIENGTVNSFELPRNFDPHNSNGGIRGIFFVENEPYGLMVTRNIGCQNAAIINLINKIEIFRTDCLPTDQSKIHFDAIGGASVHLDDELLVSIGTPTNSYQPIRDLAQKENSYYGKIISINKKSISQFLKNEAEIDINIFSKGHRNPQGLEIINKKIFSTEHGPKGGDELNLIIKNGNYGWPIASYGTKYENLSSAAYELNHLNNGFIEPMYQFTPSVAISDLVKCTNQLIDYYGRDGCLLATSLRDQSLIIFLLSENLDRVIGIEKIDFGQRLRHIAKKYNGETFSEPDGSIFISSDQGNVIKVYFNLIKD